MDSSKRGLDRTGLIGCQNAPSLGFDFIPPWRMGKVGKDVSMFLRGSYSDPGEAILFSEGYPPLVFFLY